MTIKEVENLSGLTRANIRFYEAEGLLVPQRLANQYRDYTEENLETLKRIKLLRSLRMSLEDIKALHAGGRELTDMLDRHLAQLKQEKEDIEGSREICEIMRRDGVRYQTLDAQRYLDALESLASQGQSGQSQVCQNQTWPSQSKPGLGWPVSFETDIIPEDRAPWRRYFARFLDIRFYVIVWQVLLLLVFHVNITARGRWSSLVDNAVGVLLMLALEPILLSRFGTTPGKWIWGLSVTDCEGRRLTYEQARDRTWQILRQGLGFFLPVYGIIRLWKSYKEKQDWEYRSEIILRDRRVWRIATYIGVHLFFFAALLFSYQLAGRPPHRGEITVEEFCDNYNYLAKFYGIDSGSLLDSRGRWASDYRKINTFGFGGNDLFPDFRFTETDGVMTGMEYSIELTGNDVWLQDYQNEMALSILAFAGAQEEGIRLFSETDHIIKAISREPFAGFEASAYGVRITCNIHYTGYYDMTTMLIPEENPRFSMHFSMQRQ